MRATLGFVATALLAIACGDSSSSSNPAPFDPDQTYDPDVSPDGLSLEITNDLSPAPVGAMWVFESVTADGTEHIEVTVTSESKDIASGATARVVRDTAWFEGEMIEDTRDWFGQDADGNVWYLGEDTAELENGEVVSTEGSWIGGEDDAKPGILIPASPAVGVPYRQEYRPCEAEDMGEVIATSESVTVGGVTHDNCLHTRDTTPLEPDVQEDKFYCPGVGLVLTLEGDAREELVSMTP